MSQNEPNIITLSFLNGPLSQLEIKVHQPTPGSGGAVMFAISQSDKLNGKPFWEIMQSVTHALNATPDYVNIRAPEIAASAQFVSFYSPSGQSNYNPTWDYPNTRGGHVLACGEKAYIDRTLIHNTGIVADKILREMHALGIISQRDMDLARVQLHEAGYEAEPYRGQYYSAAQALLPTCKVDGVGLTRETLDLVQSLQVKSETGGSGFLPPRPGGLSGDRAVAAPSVA